MACKYTYKGITYNSKEEFINQVINPQFLGKSNTITTSDNRFIYTLDNGIVTVEPNIDNINNLPIFKNDEDIKKWLEKNDEIIIPPLNKQIVNKDTNTKTRRILEVQSDLFQKGRDKKVLTKGSYKAKDGLTYEASSAWIQKPGEEAKEIRVIKSDKYTYGETFTPINSLPQDVLDYFKTKSDTALQQSDNQFLQLLNQGSNWVTFFIKSIIQDSSKKGYEKVLFPSGNTASKVEGHSTLEEFKKQKEDRLKQLEANLYYVNVSTASKVNRTGFKTKEEAEKFARENNSIAEKSTQDEYEINQLKEELERVEKEGFGALKPIYNFYENTVTNILKKQGYNPVLITDEYGNTWNEIILTKEQAETPILFQTMTPLEQALQFAERWGLVYINDQYSGRRGFVSKNGLASKKLVDRMYKQLEKTGGIYADIAPAYDRVSGVINFKNKKTGYMMFNVKETSQRADAKGMTAIKRFLEKVGVTVEEVEKIKDREGNALGISGAAYPTMALIRYLKGKAESVLPEEAFHIAVAIVKQNNPQLFKQMFDRIGGMKEFEEIYERYKNVYVTKEGKPDIKRIKEEAMAHVLVEKLLRDSELDSFVARWWETVKNWFKSFLTSSEIQKEIDEFDIVYRMVIENQFEEKSAIGLDGEVMYNVDTLDAIEKRNPKQTEIINSIKERAKKITAIVTSDENKYVNNETGKDVKFRPSQLAKTYKNTKEPTEEEKKDWDEKREGGTWGHADAMHILLRLIDKTTGLKKLKKDDRGNYVPLTNYTIYKALEDHLTELIETFPNDTRFLIEQLLYDPKSGSGVNDIAGTIDFGAILPNGKMEVLDWKFTGFDVTKNEDVPAYKKGEWQRQMKEYINMLKSYNVTEFGRTRMIPIITSYSRVDPKDTKSKKVPSSITMAPVSLSVGDKTYLLPVPAVEERTGNPLMDNYISKLNALYEVISGTPVKEKRKDLKAQQLNSLLKAIRHLQVEGNIIPLLEQIEVLIKSVERTEKRIQEAMDKDITDEEREELAKEANVQERSLSVFKDINLIFKDIFKENATESQKKLANLLMVTSHQVGLTLVNFTDVISAFTAKKIAEDKAGIKNLLLPEKAVKGLAKEFRTLSQSATAAMQTLWRLVNNANMKAEQNTLSMVDELERVNEGVKKWGIGKSPLAYLSLLKKKKDGKLTNQLIDTYVRSFYDEAKNATEGIINNVEWIKNNINVDAYMAWAKEYKERRIKEIEETHFAGDEEAQKERKQREKEKIEKVVKLETADYFHLSKFPQDKHFSEEYLELRRNPEILALFEFIQKWNKKATEVGYLNEKATRTFLPHIRKTLAEKMILGGDYSILKNIVGSLTIDDKEVGYGSVDPITGRIQDTIPVYFTTPLSSSEEQSEDLVKNLAIFAAQVLDYEQKSDIEAQVKLLHFVEKNKKSLATNENNELVEGAEEIQSNEDNAKLLYKFIQNTVFGQNYVRTDGGNIVGGTLGVRYNKMAEAINKKTGLKLPVLPEDAANRRISLTKTLESLNTMFQLKALGVNVGSSVAQFFGGNFQAIINAGEFYNRADFFKAELSHSMHKVFKNSPEFHIKMMEQFMPVNYALQQKIRAFSASKLQKHSVSDLLMFMMRSAEHSVAYANFIAMMNNAIIINGKIVNARTYYRSTPEWQNLMSLSAGERREAYQNFDNKVKQLVDEFGIEKMAVKDAEGNFTLPIDQDSFFDYKTKIKKLSSMATGNIQKGDEMHFRMNVYTRSMLVFKNWIPRAVDLRVSELKYNVGMDNYEWGRWRTSMSLLSYGIFNVASSLNDVLKMNDKGVEKIKKMYLEEKELWEKRHPGKIFELSEQDFADLVRRNVEAQIKELQILLATASALIGMLQLKPDDDDDKEAKSFYNYTHKILDKVMDEISFYYNPLSAQTLVNGAIFPAAGVFNDLIKFIKHFAQEGLGIVLEKTVDGEMGLEWQETAYPVKYLTRNFPVFREGFTYWAIFDGEFAKEFDIRISPESRRRQ